MSNMQKKRRDTAGLHHKREKLINSASFCVEVLFVRMYDFACFEHRSHLESVSSKRLFRALGFAFRSSVGLLFRSMADDGEHITCYMAGSIGFARIHVTPSCYYLKRRTSDRREPREVVFDRSALRSHPDLCKVCRKLLVQPDKGTAKRQRTF